MERADELFRRTRVLQTELERELEGAGQEDEAGSEPGHAALSSQDDHGERDRGDERHDQLADEGVRVGDQVERVGGDRLKGAGPAEVARARGAQCNEDGEQRERDRRRAGQSERPRGDPSRDDPQRPLTSYWGHSRAHRSGQPSRSLVA